MNSDFSVWKALIKSREMNLTPKQAKKVSLIKYFLSIIALLAFLAVISFFMFPNNDSYEKYKEMLENGIEYEIQYDTEFTSLSSNYYELYYTYTDSDGNVQRDFRIFLDFEDVIELTGTTAKIKYDPNTDTVLFLPFNLPPANGFRNTFLCILGVIALVFVIIITINVLLLKFGSKEAPEIKKEPTISLKDLEDPSNNSPKKTFSAKFHSCKSAYLSNGENKFQIIFTYEEDGITKEDSTEYCYSFQEAKNLQKLKTFTVGLTKNKYVILDKTTAEESSFCLYCGAKIPNGSQFCIKCGAEQK